MARLSSLCISETMAGRVSASRSALESRGKSSRFPLAIVDGPVQWRHLLPGFHGHSGRRANTLGFFCRSVKYSARYFSICFILSMSERS